MLDGYAELLENHRVGDVLARSEEYLAVAHGRQRAGLDGYDIDQLIEEYRLLRQAILEALDAGGPITTEERDALLDAIQVGVRNAAGVFARARGAELAASHEALAQAAAELEARVSARTAELAESEERLHTLVEGVKDYAIYTVDPLGHITSWNKGAERMTGYAPAEIVGQHFSVLYPEEGRRRDEPMHHLEVAEGQGRFRGEGMRVRKDGEAFLADVLITPMHVGGALRGFSKVVQDLTERSQLLQERDLSREAVERLRAQAAYRQRFVSTLTHDLRSPLQAARAAALLIARSPERHDAVRGWAQRINDIVDRADAMISDLLDVSRLEAGERLPLRFEGFDLAALAQDVCDEMATRHGARFTVLSDGDTAGVWSRDGMRRVLENLLSNAVKYGEAGAGITVRVQGAGPRVFLSVHNVGSLIPEEEQARLFDAFHRTASADASRAQGWGLGLALVSGIVGGHGGQVKVESYPKEGTTFTVDLPVDASGRPSAPG